MTREEEIKQVANACYDDIECYFSFITGAEWADDNPPQGIVNLNKVWHDASEMPNNHSYIMFIIDRYTIKTDYVPACLKHCQLNRSNWNEFVKDANIKQWAYINDLLPKTKEL